MRQDPARYQPLIQSLGRSIAASLRGYQIRWTEEEGKDVEMLIGSDPPLFREAWHQMKVWYWAAVGRAPPPARFTRERVTAERVDLYSYVPPLRENIPISVEPFPVEDSVTTEEEIKWAAKQLRNHCSRGPSGMMPKHIKGWMMEARKKEEEEALAAKKSAMEGTTEVLSETWS